MITICWWDASGDEQRLPVAQLAYVPAVGTFIDLEDVSDELLEKHIREDERVDLAHLCVVEVVHKLGSVEVTVERDVEVTHQRELNGKDETISYLQRTASHAINLLQVVAAEPADGLFFAFDGGDDSAGRDLVAVHVAEGTTLSRELTETIDAIFVYPTREAAQKQNTSRTCIKHRHQELVTKGKR